MSVRRVVGRASAAAVLVLGVVLALLVLPVETFGAAAGGDAAGGAVTDPTTSPVPVVLARTGLDLTTPIVVGLSILLLGTALVAWAVLRGSGDAGRGTHD